MNTNPCDKQLEYCTPPPGQDPARVFWMVYVAGGNVPATRHYAVEEAVVEAERLARKEVGRPVYLLRAARYVIVPASVRWQDCGG